MKINKQLVSYKKNGWGYNSMSPIEITIHNTANSAPAINERNYVESQLTQGKNTATFHYAVDENEVVQLLPHNINGWHSGDGDNGTGNRKSIGIEICRSTGGDYNGSEKNAIELCAKLIKDGTIRGVDKIKFHYHRSGKNCPHKMINDRGGVDKALTYFRGEVSKLLNDKPVENKPTTPSTNEKVYKEYAENGTITFTDEKTPIYATLEDALKDGKPIAYYYKGEIVKYQRVYLTKDNKGNKAYSYVRYNRASGGYAFVCYQNLKTKHKVGIIK